MVRSQLSAVEAAQLIAGGEDSYTEFKSADTSNRDLAKELVAFLNMAGGRILIGVSDEGVVEGFASIEEESIMNLARTLIDPPAIPTWQVVEIPGSAPIAVVSVDVGTEKPYAVGGGEGKRYYVRVGSTSREASREDLIRLTQASGSVQGDLRAVLSATMEDLDEDALRKRFEGRRTLDWANLKEDERRRVLTDAEILHAESGAPTIAGMLCFGANPQARLPMAVLQCVAYPADSVTQEIVDKATIGGRVSEQVQEAADFILRNLRHGSAVSGVARVDNPMPSIESIRELIANAVAHRYYGVDSPVLVRVFETSIEVLSPGGLPNGVTPEAMRIGVSVPRNPFVVHFLESQGIVDALGRGIVLVEEELAEKGLPQLEIETPPGFVLLRLRLVATL